MDTQLVATKWYIPPPRPTRITRPRLLTRLEGSWGAKLTLICAPAGFGKTTLASAWLTANQRPVAWLSLEDTDNDLVRFLTYLVAAAQTIAPKFGYHVMSALQSAQPTEMVLSAFLNELAVIPNPFVLVLDDYHVIHTPTIDQALTFIIDHLPAQGHVVITTRQDPDLPLARWRVRHQLIEIRAAELRFTPTEAAEFLTQTMGLSVSAHDAERLAARTEGWVAGLQLAALALQAQPPTSTPRFIRTFTGRHRFVLEYLVAEVVAQQPQPIQDFLLYTAVLDRLCGELCDAVALSQSGVGERTLSDLERANLFLIPLDEERRWYRYHHLFAESLQARLAASQPDLIPELHRRASVWYAQNGSLPDAIHHALTAQDFDHAAGLIERIWPMMRRTRQEATFLRWMRALPDDLPRSRPVLSVVYAWALLDAGDLDGAEARLQQAEYLLEQPTRWDKVVDEAQFRSLPASIANARAYRAQASNDVASTIHYARLALDLLPLDDYYERGTTTALLGLAYWASGALDAAYQSFADGLSHLERGGGLLIRMGGTVILAHIRMAQGYLEDTLRLYEQSLALGLSAGESPLKGTAEMYLGLSDIHRQRGDFQAARRYFEAGTALRAEASLPGYDHLWSSVDAQLHWAEGNQETAFALLREAERLYYRSPIPDVRPISALRARLHLAAGQISEAQAWVRERSLSPYDEVSYLREYEYLTLAQILLAQHQHHGDSASLNQASELLARLLKLAQAQGRTASITEIEKLQRGQAVPPPQPLIEPLSERELAVLRLFKTELSGPDIARELSVALSTVRTHTKHIYGKLGVSNRRAAVNRAQALKLID